MIKASELIINSDKSIYHLGLKPHHIVENIIVVGDPGRVELVASFFDSVTHTAQNREYRTVIGTFKNKPVMVISSGIGCGPIDILINELDALVNVDFDTLMPKKELTKLNIIRLGTTGAISDNIDLGDIVMSKYTIGIDGLAHFYAESPLCRVSELEKIFHKSIFNCSSLVIPYAVESSKELVSKFEDMSRLGVTMCAGGFFAPQGRKVRLQPTFDSVIESLAEFKYDGLELTNIEMEGAAMETLALMLGHKTITMCVAVAHRSAKVVNIDYHNKVKDMIEKVLERL